MSGSQGLNFNAIQQNLQAAGEEGTITTKFATENYVDNQILNKFNPVPNVNFDVTLNGATSVSVSGGSNETVVTFGLSTTLGDIKDVNLTTNPPFDGQYLQYNGSNWVAGNGASVFSITNLTDFQPAIGTSDGLIPFAFLRVNGQGSSIIMDPTNVVSKIFPRSGILVENVDSEYFIQSDVSNLGRAFVDDDSPDNYFAVAINDNTDTRRIMKSDIALEGFSKGNFMEDSDIFTSVTSGSSNILNWTPGTNGDGTGTLTLDMSTILTTGGSGNVLPISQGGTSASNAVDAREKLEVSYNKDVIKYSRGEFRDTLIGDNIQLVGGASSVSIVNPGSGYTNGTCVMNLIGYNNAQVTATISGGSVISITNVSNLLPYIPYNLPSVNIRNSVGGGPSNAIISIELEPSYLNFGLSIGNSVVDNFEGCGFRFNPGTCIVEFREGLGSEYSWAPFTNIPGISELGGVSQSSFDPISLTGGELLIYNSNNSLWTATGLSGPVQIAFDGTVTLSGISPQTIATTDPSTPITVSEFSTLSGMCGNIQNQLNDKIEVTNGITRGDIIYYSGTCPSGAREFENVPRTGGSRSFLNIGTSIPDYENLYHGFEFDPNLPGTSSRFCILDETLERAKSYDLSTTVDFISGTSGGIGKDGEGKLALDYLKLEHKSSVQLTDLIATGISNSVGISPVQSITVQDFVSSIAGTGVCGSTGFLNLQVQIGASPNSLTGTFEDGELAYFYHATNPGPSVLAVRYEGSWYGASVSLVS